MKQRLRLECSIDLLLLTPSWSTTLCAAWPVHLSLLPDTAPFSLSPPSHKIDKSFGFMRKGPFCHHVFIT